MNKNGEHDLSPQLSSTIKEEIVSRRAVLKSALTLGCGVLLPVVLIGCDSKQSDSSSSAAPSATPKPAATTPAAPNASAQPTAPGTATNTPAASTPGKVPQASVRYQDQPNGDQKCSGCALFVEPNACSVVEGTISPEGWCSIWAPKAS